VDDLDLYVAANLLLQRFGDEEAMLYCAQRAGEMLEAGDMERRRAWQRVEDAVWELTRLPGEGDAVN
jgi:hypothetical protein